MLGYFKCILFGCSGFIYHSPLKRECRQCHREQLFLNFYPSGASWVDKEFALMWGSYKNLIETKTFCPGCEKMTNKCLCNIC